MAGGSLIKTGVLYGRPQELGRGVDGPLPFPARCWSGVRWQGLGVGTMEHKQVYWGKLGANTGGPGPS